MSKAIDHDTACEREQSRCPATIGDFDRALSDVRTIAGIVKLLAFSELETTTQVDGAAYAWLADELDARLERVEVAGMTMRGR